MTPDLTLPGQTSSVPKAVAKGDKHIWGIYLALCLVSIIELYSASSREVAASSIGVFGPILRHLVLLGAGAGITIYISRIHYSRFKVFTIYFAMISAALMIYVMFFGDIINGARRSVSLPGFTVFPAEMVKISAVLLVALIMGQNQDSKSIGITKKGMLWAAGTIIFFSALLIEQGLTNTLLLVAISGSMMVIGGVKWLDLLYFVAGFAVLGVIGLAVLYLVDIKGAERAEIPADAEQVEMTGSTHQSRSRIATWLARLDRHDNASVAKWELPATGNYRQEVLSYAAQAHGGIHGVGPGNSREASRLPLAFSDYIYAIVVEELGMIGGIGVLLLYLWLLGRASGIASRCTRTYPALLVIGMAVMIAFQALFHMGIVTGYFPVSGQPLPLISKGGTSIVVTCIAFGIMLSVSRTATRRTNTRAEQEDERDALPDDLNSENRMQL